MRLKKLEAFDEAAFYETEILKITKTNSTKKKKQIVLFYIFNNWFNINCLFWK